MTHQEFMERMKQRDREKRERLEEFNKVMDRLLKSKEQSKQGGLEKDNSFDRNSPKQRRIFERMGMVLKVEKPKEGGGNKANHA